MNGVKEYPFLFVSSENGQRTRPHVLFRTENDIRELKQRLLLTIDRCASAMALVKVHALGIPQKPGQDII